jgi:biopolymer transport protein ExbD
MGGGGGGGDGEPEFQIAPMIDVLLVLLIFFMSITTSQVMKVDKDIQLPLAPDAKPKEKKNNTTGEDPLNIKWDPTKLKATLNFDGKNYDQTSELVAVLQKRKENYPIYRVIIRGDKRLPAVEIQKAMAVLGEAGMDNIAFSAQDK